MTTLRAIAACCLILSLHAGAGAEVTIGPNVSADTVADLANLRVPDGSIVWVRGYEQPKDGGGGPFRANHAGNAGDADGGMIFAAPTGTFEREVQHNMVSPLFYASADSTTDWTTPIQAALDYCQANDATFHWTAHHYNGSLVHYDIGASSQAGVKIQCTTDAAPMAEIHVDNTTSDFTGVTVGEDSGAAGGNLLFKQVIELPRIKVDPTNGTQWVAGTLRPNLIGLHIEGLRHGTLRFNEIEGFGIGLLMEPNSNYGVDSNRIFGNHVNTNAIGIAIRPGDDGGWANECYWYINRISVQSGKGADIAGVYGISLDQQDASRFNPNSHHFYGTNIEGQSPATSMQYEIHCVGASSNTFNQFRFEGGDPKAYFTGLSASEESQFNTINDPWGGAVLDVINDVNAVGNSVKHNNGSAEYDLGGRNSGAGFSGFDYVLGLRNASSSASPSLIVMEAGDSFWDTSVDSSTGWAAALGANELRGKRGTDAVGSERVVLDWQNGHLKVGDGGGNFTTLDQIGSATFGIDQNTIIGAVAVADATLEIGDGTLSASFDGVNDLLVADDLNVNGDAEIDLNLTVDGTATVNDTIQMNGNQTISVTGSQALLVEDGVGTDRLVVDTTNGRVGVNFTPTADALAVDGDISVESGHGFVFDERNDFGLYEENFGAQINSYENVIVSIDANNNDTGNVFAVINNDPTLYGNDADLPPSPLFQVSEAGDVGVGETANGSGRIFRAPTEVATSDATPTTLDGFATATNAVYHVVATVVATETAAYDESASYIFAGTFVNDGGTLSQVGTTDVLHVSETTGAWDADFTLNGTNIEVAGTGGAATDVRWHTQVELMQIQ